MNTIKIFLENCYGIHKLEYEFIFNNGHKTFSVYSPNGMMKTSLAKTFNDLREEKESEDLIFPDRETKRKIEKDGKELGPAEVFVIQPYDESFYSDKMSTLLVNQNLRKEYEKAHSDIDNEKSNLLGQLKNMSGLKTSEEIEKEISTVFIQDEENKFFEALESIQTRIKKDPKDFGEISYNKIFNDRSLGFLESEEVQKDIKEYVEKYDELIEKSVYFKKGIFNHSQAEDVAKQLTKNGFFKADHSVLLKGYAQKISSQTELQKIIEEEKNRILENKELRKKFNVLDGKLIKNQQLRDFREYLLNHTLILPELNNPKSFKAKLWTSYLKRLQDKYDSLLQVYNKSKERIDEITQQAVAEKTKWFSVVEIFNRRFFVPFEVSIGNQIEVILKNEIPVVDFKFKDEESSQTIKKEELLEVLSQGEKRALYILNIIFEIEARKQDGQETLFIIDDIADSFDYKNKYAIIEYLRDVAKETQFYQIILTHNFDFHRTVSSRLDMGRENRLNALKTNSGIKLIQEKYQKNPFNDWRQNLSDSKKLVASIPFIRNLAEFSGDDECFEKLTSFLHIKDGTENLTIENLKQLFDSILRNTNIGVIKDLEKKFLDLLQETADSIADENNENMSLEDKITLAIQIRLTAEQFIIGRGVDPSTIDKNQTYELVEKYKNMYPKHLKQIKTLEKVLLMTPENIHVNSFMYEPIIDMSGHHLIQLHNEMKKINS